MGEVEGICATHNYTLLSSLAEKLRVNAAEEYSVFLQSFCAIFRGVGVLPLPSALGLYGHVGLSACLGCHWLSRLRVLLFPGCSQIMIF